MSTWTFKSAKLRLGILALSATVLAACSGTLLNGPAEKVVVAGKSVVIAGPPGYCVDATATRDTETGAFVLLGSCASIANSAGLRAPKTPGLLTASVSGTIAAEIGGSLDQLEGFFTSRAGRAALARDGRAGSVKILDTRRQSDAFYLHVRDTSRTALAGVSQDYWRGLFDVRGRIVTVSVVGFKAAPMSDAQGLATLDAFAARIKHENPGDAGPTHAALYGRLLQ